MRTVNVRLPVALMISILSLASCATWSSSDTGPKQQARLFAAEACNIKWFGEDGLAVRFGEGKPRFVPPKQSGSDPSIALINDLEDEFDSAQRANENAAAAAQLDPIWQNLSRATSDVATIKRLHLQMRRSGLINLSFRLDGRFGRVEERTLNDGLQTYLTECRALLSRL